MAFRFLHTADWHLGQTLHSFDRTAEHAAFFEKLIEIVKERQPHALLMAGDVFDTANPGAESQRLYFAFLAQLQRVAPGLQVVLTAGNHDAAARLESPDALLRHFAIRAVGIVPRDATGAIDYAKFIMPLTGDEPGKVVALALAVPFLRQSDLPATPDAANPYTAGVRRFYHELTALAAALRDEKHPGAALIALGHCHLQSAERSPHNESERDILIGGEEALAPDTFPPDLAYVALGHLHKPQDNLAGGRIRYSGSPIPLSFSEIDYQHRVLELTLDDAGKLAAAKSHPIPKHTRLLQLPKQAADTASVIHAINQYSWDNPPQPGQHPLLELRVRETGPEPDRRARLEKALEGKPVRLAKITLEHAPSVESGTPDAITSLLPAGAGSLKELSARAVFTAAFKEEFGLEHNPDAQVNALFAAIVDEVDAESSRA